MDLKFDYAMISKSVGEALSSPISKYNANKNSTVIF